MTNGHDRNATALAALRIVVGLFFVIFGEYKVFGTDFTLHGQFEEWVRGFLAQSAYPWMKPVLVNVVLPHARACAFLTAYGELMIGLGLVTGVLTRAASGFGILLMALLLASAGYPGPHVALWRYFGASLEWSVFIACFAAFIIGEPEARWSLMPRLRSWLQPRPERH
ncbi:MAG TPA: DoxX family membrane protein [Terracidiphilus sp.]|jgi:thiosulfate dehydrogenase [quinone] large subunit|nr:DoxX family membrane protein [Terracidiphilus sp.]